MCARTRMTTSRAMEFTLVLVGDAAVMITIGTCCA